MENLDWSGVEAAFADAVERGVIPGATIVVRKGADIIFEGKFGFRSLVPQRQPMELDTVFDLSSLTKPLATTIAVMILVREGKLRLDDRVPRLGPAGLERVDSDGVGQTRRVRRKATL